MSRQGISTTEQPTAYQRLIRARHSDQFATLVLRRHASETADRLRNHFGVGEAPVKAHCDPMCDFCRGVASAADFIDPEVQQR